MFADLRVKGLARARIDVSNVIVVDRKQRRAHSFDRSDVRAQFDAFAVEVCAAPRDEQFDVRGGREAGEGDGVG